MHNQEINLIVGSFSPQEARKVLTTVIKSKINYHKIELLSDYERFNTDESNSHKRIAYLQNALENVLELVNKAIEENKSFEIVGNISVIIK